MSRIRAISRPVNVTVLAKSLRNVRTPSATKMSRSCSVGRPNSLLPCTCQTTLTLAPSGNTLLPLISILPTRLPTRRSSTANGMAARFSSSTDRFIKEARDVGFALTGGADPGFSIAFLDLYNAVIRHRHLFIGGHMVCGQVYDQPHAMARRHMSSKPVTTTTTPYVKVVKTVINDSISIA